MKIVKRHKQLKRFESDSRSIKFYLDNLEHGKQLCFEYEVKQDVIVSNAKPGLLKVYDYYEPDVVVDHKYKIKQTCGTKLAIPYFNQTAVDDNDTVQRREGVTPLVIMPSS